MQDVIIQWLWKRLGVHPVAMAFSMLMLVGVGSLMWFDERITSKWAIPVVVAALVAFAGVLQWAWPKVDAEMTLIGMRRAARKYLHRCLMGNEKKILASYLQNDLKAQHFHETNGTAIELTRFHILRLTSEKTRANEQIFYAIQPWAVDELRKHPELLK